jgi:V-type H+-transporting ATPase subunit a
LPKLRSELWALFSFQAGEFFHSAQSSAAAQQRELEVQHIGDGSIDSPLLLEQVKAY